MENFVVKGDKNRALFFATLAFFAGFAGVSAYGPIVPMLKKTLNLSPFSMSFLAAAPALIGSLLRIPFGAMVDRTGGKKPTLILLFLSAVGILGMAKLLSLPLEEQTTNLFLFVAFGMLAGCGIATFSVGIPTVSYWFPQKSQGMALAIYGGLGNTAPGFFAILLPLLIARFGFGYSYLIWLLMLIAAGFLIATFMHDAPSFQLERNGHIVDHKNPNHRRILNDKFQQELVPTGNMFASLKIAAGTWNTWLLTCIYFTTFGGFIALTAWLPTFWMQNFGTTIILAGTLTAVYSLSASAARMVGGIISDKLGGEKILGLSLIIMLVGSLVMIAAINFNTTLVAQLLLALSMGAANAAVFKLVPKFAPTTVGGTTGIVGGLGAFGGFGIPLALGGFVSRFGSYTKAFAIFAALALISLILLKKLKTFNSQRL